MGRAKKPLIDTLTAISGNPPLGAGPYRAVRFNLGGKVKRQGIQPEVSRGFKPTRVKGDLFRRGGETASPVSRGYHYSVIDDIPNHWAGIWRFVLREIRNMPDARKL
jgi:hypothetical protein